MKVMQNTEKSVHRQSVEGNDILVARKPCDELYNTLGEIQFSLQGTVMNIKPKGYLYHQPMQPDCFIGVQSIPDDANQYRLGRIFMRNFYTALDFDQNIIMIGPNAFSSAQAKSRI